VCTCTRGFCNITLSLGVIVSPIFPAFLYTFSTLLHCLPSLLHHHTARNPPRADLPLPFSTLALRFRSYALQHAGVRVIWDVGNDVFKKQLEQLPDVLLRITSGLLGSVESYRYRLLDLKRIAVAFSIVTVLNWYDACDLRQGEATDSEVLGRLCRMLSALDRYRSITITPL
jgi:hypothetical protein